MGIRSCPLAVAALLLAVAVGCGTARTAGRTITVPGYDAYPPNTITVENDSPRSPACRADARAFVSQSRLYLAHEGPQSAYPSDVAYVSMRQGLADFAARRCDPALLGQALRARLTAKQLTALVGYVPRPMAASLRQALAAARG